MTGGQPTASTADFTVVASAKGTSSSSVAVT